MTKHSVTRVLTGMILLLCLAFVGCGSNTATSTTPADNGASTVVPPVAPLGVIADCGNFKITVSWQAATGATGYNVYRSTTQGALGALQASVAILTYNDTTGAVGTRYYYTVTAVNSAGESLRSAEVSEVFYKVLAGAMQGSPLVLTNTVSTFAGLSGFSGLINGIGTSARFSLPQGLTTDGRFIYVADYLNNAVRRIDPATQEVTLFAGSPTGSSGYADGVGTAALFFRPYDITSDGASLYVTDYNNCLIRKIDIATAAVSTFAGTFNVCNPSLDGISTAAKFASPQGITTDGVSLFVTENTVVRRIDIATQAVTTFAGTGSVGHNNAVGTLASFNNLEGITTDGVSLFVADRYYNDIRRIDIATANVTSFAGVADPVATSSLDGTGTAARFNLPMGITTDGTNLYVVELWGDVVRKIDIATATVITLAGSPAITGTLDGVGSAARFSAPWGITTYCGVIFIGDTSNGSIRLLQ